MTTTRTNKEILRIALPSILANITVPLVGMVDMIVAGHLDSSAATLIGGISIGTMLFDLLYWNFGFLRVSTGGLTAQATGKQDWRACADIFVRSTGLAFVIAFVLVAVQWFFVKFVFLFVQCSPQVRELAERYFFIRIWAAPATLGLMSLKGWFIGMQDSVSSMVTDLTVNILNILLSFVLSLGFSPWGFKGIGYSGIATGTVLAQFSGLITGLVIVFVKYRKAVFSGYSVKDAVSAMKGPGTRRFFSMNTDIFIRSLCFIAIYIGFTVISARYGDTLLASASIMMKLMMIFSYFTDGFAYAGEALCGKYIGAEDKEAFTMSVKWTFIWSCAVAALFILVYGLFSDSLLSMMTKDREVIEISREFLPWLLLMPVVGVIAFTWDGIFIGATDSKSIRNAMLWSVTAFFSVWFLGNIFTPDGPGAIHLLMGAYFAHLVARDIHLSAKYRTNVLEKNFQG